MQIKELPTYFGQCFELLSLVFLFTQFSIFILNNRSHSWMNEPHWFRSKFLKPNKNLWFLWKDPAFVVTNKSFFSVHTFQNGFRVFSRFIQCTFFYSRGWIVIDGYSNRVYIVCICWMFFLCSTWCRFRNVLFWYMNGWISRLIFRRFFHFSTSSMAICLLDQERVKCLCLCCVSMWYKNMHIIQMQQLDTRRIRAYLGVCRKKVCCMLVCVCIWSRKMRK